MAMSNPATTDDLVDRGYVLPQDSPVPQTRLDQVWRALRREVPSIETSLTAGWLTVEDVADVVADATMRVLDNPEGIVEESESIDDWSETRKRANATADVYFTAAEIRRLTPVIPTAGSLRYC
jgi:hypothetical protein